jgi:hypothetical protein
VALAIGSSEVVKPHCPKYKCLHICKHWANTVNALYILRVSLPRKQGADLSSPYISRWGGPCHFTRALPALSEVAKISLFADYRFTPFAFHSYRFSPTISLPARGATPLLGKSAYRCRGLLALLLSWALTRHLRYGGRCFRSAFAIWWSPCARLLKRGVPSRLTPCPLSRKPLQRYSYIWRLKCFIKKNAKKMYFLCNSLIIRRGNTCFLCVSGYAVSSHLSVSNFPL